MKHGYKAVAVVSGSPEPVGLAARRLADHFGLPLLWGAPKADSMIVAVNVADLPKGTFTIRQEGSNLVFSGDCPRTALAGALYHIHHDKLGHVLELPLARTSPFDNRLIMEDFPFMCYWPTGFDFDLDAYAENLVALGFTAMECNRFSRLQPREPHQQSYAFTNPSPSHFVWTPWHEGVWERERVEANAAELRAVINTSVKYGLTPTVTTFLPRPYFERFFDRHPGMRGEVFLNGHMVDTGHAPLYRLDTDKQEVQDFYERIYRELFDRFPEIGHLFFWHGDLGSGFSRDTSGGSGMINRMAGFHRMIQSLLKEKSMDAKVWINPWHLIGGELAELDALPGEVGFSIKDNVGVPVAAGTTRLALSDATVITAEIGTAAKAVMQLAEKAGRQVCLAQYQDFSEDLDPVVAVPHPIMTFCKLEKLLEASPDYSSVNWGVISPDVAGTNINQNVIREFTWGDIPASFNEMLGRLIPSSFTEPQVALLTEAWVCVDDALKIWPQFWGLRLQDSGMRLRWLVKPFGFDADADPEEVFSFWLERQIYRYNVVDPLNAFMNITPVQAIEVSGLYADMANLVARARGLLLEIKPMSDAASGWLVAQANSLRTLELFWITYRNLLGFWGQWLLFGKTDKVAMGECSGFVASEIDNVAATIDHLSAHPETIVIAGKGAWGQCFGSDYIAEFSQKLKAMERSPFKAAFSREDQRSRGWREAGSTKRVYERNV